MRRAGLLAVALAAVMLAPPGRATAATQGAQVEFDQFSPTPLDVLPGETVRWSNVSDRTHTVTASDGSFDSGDLDPGKAFSHRYTAVGHYAYYCMLHPEMTGEIDVRRVTLDTLAGGAVVAGSSLEFSGRTADGPRPVVIERDVGKGYRAIGTAKPGAHGTWRTTLPVEATGDYRAAVGRDLSETRRLLVNDRKVHIRATRRGVAVSVSPPDPYGRVRLEEYRRERFGWWPLPVVHLDYLSSAEFRVRRPARVRVVLVGRDMWTPLATSPVVALHRGGAA